MKLEFFKPIYPLKINQGWGTLDPKDYAQFGFTRHNGIDMAIGSDALVRAPYDGTLVEIGNQPNGGGIYLGFVSDNEYDFDEFICITPEKVEITFPAMKARVLTDFLHLKSISAKVATHYKCGQVLAIQDNTGFSTGPHTHVQNRRVSWDGKKILTLDINDAHNSFDPTQFYAMYAKDFLSISDQLKILIQKVANLFKK